MDSGKIIENAVWKVGCRGFFVKGKEFLNSKPDKNHQTINIYVRYLDCTKNLDVKLPINEQTQLRLCITV